jgi:hypothetical protein
MNFTCLDVGQTPETLTLVGETARHALFLTAKLLLARLHRGLALLELREPLQVRLKLGLARRERRRHLSRFGLPRRERGLALVEAREAFQLRAQLCFPALELGLRLADRALAAVELGELRQASSSRAWPRASSFRSCSSARSFSATAAAFAVSSATARA